MKFMFRMPGGEISQYDTYATVLSYFVLEVRTFVIYKAIKKIMKPHICRTSTAIYDTALC